MLDVEERIFQRANLKAICLELRLNLAVARIKLISFRMLGKVFGDFVLFLERLVPFRELIPHGIVGLIGQLLQHRDHFVGQIAVVATLLCDCGFGLSFLSWLSFRLIGFLQTLHGLSHILRKIERIGFFRGFVGRLSSRSFDRGLDWGRRLVDVK